MTTLKRLIAVSSVLLLAGLAGAATPAETPLGHKDFYPSPELPIGFRGDGNGYFPGATPVTGWRSGTIGTEKRGAVEQLITIDKKSHNVVWATEMPSWANTQPIVVGDRVFTTAEPNLLSVWMPTQERFSGRLRPIPGNCRGWTSRRPTKSRRCTTSVAMPFPTSTRCAVTEP